jgi:hypothetical protein
MRAFLFLYRLASSASYRLECAHISARQMGAGGFDNGHNFPFFTPKAQTNSAARWAQRTTDGPECCAGIGVKALDAILRKMGTKT